MLLLRRFLLLLVVGLLAACPATPVITQADFAHAVGDSSSGPTDSSMPDDGGVPVVVVQPIWIGSGGSAATSTRQLNVSVGGVDTVGTTSATSGAKLTSGHFSSQTN